MDRGDAKGTLGMSDTPAISVVMAAYNAEKTIAEAIGAILAQTLGDVELIIVEDGSADRTAERVAEFHDARIRLLRNERNLGLAPSLRRGVDAARGEFIARMDADDSCAPERFEKQLGFLREHPEVAVAGTSFNLMDEASRLYDRRVRPMDDEYLQRELLKWNPFCAGSVMMRAEVLRAVGGYDARFPTSEDYDLWLRLGEVARLAILGEVLYNWRVRPDSMTHKGRDEQLAYCRLARRHAWLRRLGGTDEFGRRLDLRPRDRTSRVLMAEHCVIWGRQALRERRTRAALRLFGRAARLDPMSRRLVRAAVRAPLAAARALFRSPADRL